MDHDWVDNIQLTLNLKLQNLNLELNSTLANILNFQRTKSINWKRRQTIPLSQWMPFFRRWSDLGEVHLRSKARTRQWKATDFIIEPQMFITEHRSTSIFLYLFVPLHRSICLNLFLFIDPSISISISFSISIVAGACGGDFYLVLNLDNQNDLWIQFEVITSTDDRNPFDSEKRCDMARIFQ